jgi:hypothetical protein
MRRESLERNVGLDPLIHYVRTSWGEFSTALPRPLYIYIYIYIYIHTEEKSAQKWSEEFREEQKFWPCREMNHDCSFVQPLA